jgi:hypothetical protein
MKVMKVRRPPLIATALMCLCKPGYHTSSLTINRALNEAEKNMKTLGTLSFLAVHPSQPSSSHFCYVRPKYLTDTRSVPSQVAFRREHLRSSTRPRSVDDKVRE